MTEELNVKAEVDNLYRVLAFIEEKLDKAGCGTKEKKQIGMAVEEIFVNIASYAYPSETGDALVRITTGEEENMVEIILSDEGYSYNPLEKPDPDLGMDIEERQYGGFGIYMVKNAMDDVQYKRQDGRNVLILKKRLTASDQTL